MIGARSVDHRQPGLNSDRATVASSRLTTAARPLGIGRISSGVAKLLYRSRGMISPLLGTAWRGLTRGSADFGLLLAHRALADWLLNVYAGRSQPFTAFPRRDRE